MAKKIISAEATLAKCETEIRRLEKDTKDHAIKNAIEIGRQLTIAKDAAGHKHWLPWLKKRFNHVTDRTALSFMQAYELSISNPKLASDLEGNIDRSGFFLLAAPSAPEDAKTEVGARAKGGEKMTKTKVKAVIKKKKSKTEPKTGKPAKSAKPAKANAAPPATTKPAAPAAKPAEQATAPPAPNGWSAEAINAARAIVTRMTEPLCWCEDDLDGKTDHHFSYAVPAMEYQVFPYEDGFKAELEFEDEIYIIGTGKGLDEVRRIAEEHWNNRETIAAPTAPSPTPDDAGVSSTGAGSEPVTLELKADSAPASSAPPAPEPNNATGAVWGIKKYSKRGKQRTGRTLTISDRQFDIDPVPSDSKKRLDGYRVTLVMPDMKEHRLKFFPRDTPRLKGKKADEDALDRATAFVREQAGLPAITPTSSRIDFQRYLLNLKIEKSAAVASKSEPAPGAEQPPASTPTPSLAGGELNIADEPMSEIIDTVELERRPKAAEDATTFKEMKAYVAQALVKLVDADRLARQVEELAQLQRDYDKASTDNDLKAMVVVHKKTIELIANLKSTTSSDDRPASDPIEELNRQLNKALCGD